MVVVVTRENRGSSAPHVSRGGKKEEDAVFTRGPMQRNDPPHAQEDEDEDGEEGVVVVVWTRENRGGLAQQSTGIKTRCCITDKVLWSSDNVLANHEPQNQATRLLDMYVSG